MNEIRNQLVKALEGRLRFLEDKVETGDDGFNFLASARSYLALRGIMGDSDELTQMDRRYGVAVQGYSNMHAEVDC